jgi:hypothetical protein
VIVPKPSALRSSSVHLGKSCPESTRPCAKIA